MRPINRVVPFKITGMDSLGQGVSKEGDKITFVPKAMVGDEGEAVITSEKKGVAFAKIKNLTSPSSRRIESPCVHFQNCPSCHYLHVPYEDELKFKEQNLERMFKKLNPPPIKVVPATQRVGYRNRIQLHYDLQKKTLGMLDAVSSQITPIPHCLIARPQILEELKRLYSQDTWMKEAPKNIPRGHVEIYYFHNELKVSWNKPYAEGGFTQVFEEMNQLLKEELSIWGKSKSLTGLLDLFAGNGNLSDNLNYSQRLCVDLYSRPQGNDFFSQDLYDKNAFKNVTDALKKSQMKPTAVLLDPPRSGFKDLEGWIKAFSPQTVAYVSCDPHTLVRDLSRLTDYSIEGLSLFDFFPSTFHFETMIFLERK